MCVAVIVASKNRVPSKHLEAMHEANPDGGGIAWYKDGVVMFRKGMTWQEIDAIQDRLPRPFFLHFRIATRGAKIAELTHPFPLGMQAFTEDLSGVADEGVLMHNGTWSGYRRYVPEGINADAVSDTQVAAYVAAYSTKILDEVNWSNAMMTPEKITYRGQWTQKDGNFYSNMHWERELAWNTYMSSRTVTPRQTKKSHQDNRNQVNGRKVGQYQTQFNKVGKGVHAVQSNGKTIKENREAKKSKRNPVENDNYYSDRHDPYDRALAGYRQSVGLASGRNWRDETTPLFKDSEIPSYPRLVQSNYNVSNGRVDKYLGPNVPCPDCKKNITQIPCECGMDSESQLEDALDAELTKRDNELDAELKALEALDAEIDAAMDEALEVASGDLGDLADVEDLNAYGMSAGLDGMGSSDYMDPEFAEIQKTIRTGTAR